MEEFTAREVEVASLVAEGLSNEEIVRVAWRVPNTVRYHLKELYSRVGASSRTTLARAFTDGSIKRTRRSK